MTKFLDVAEFFSLYLNASLSKSQDASPLSKKALKTAVCDKYEFLSRTDGAGRLRGGKMTKAKNLKFLLVAQLKEHRLTPQTNQGIELPFAA